MTPFLGQFRLGPQGLKLSQVGSNICVDSGRVGRVYLAALFWSVFPNNSLEYQKVLWLSGLGYKTVHFMGFLLYAK